MAPSVLPGRKPACRCWCILGTEALNLFKDLPGEGPLFPYLSRVRAGDRATEFASRCRQLGIAGVTLHSYRYAWAERAKTAGMPERFAMESFGAQQQGRASRLRQTRLDENSVTGRLRTASSDNHIIIICHSIRAYAFDKQRAKTAQQNCALIGKYFKNPSCFAAKVCQIHNPYSIHK